MTADDPNRANDDSGSGFGIVPKYLRGSLTAHEIAVYVALTWRANEYGRCWLRHRRLAKEAGCSISTTQRALNAMRDKGIVSWQPMEGPDGDVVCNIYTLHVWHSSPSDVRGGRSQGPRGPVTQTEGAGHTDRQKKTPRTRPLEATTGSATPTARIPASRLAALAAALADADHDDIDPAQAWDALTADGIRHPDRFAAALAAAGELGGYIEGLGVGL